jgi:hypothetical protein
VGVGKFSGAGCWRLLGSQFALVDDLLDQSAARCAGGCRFKQTAEKARTFLRSLGGAMGGSILGTICLSYGFAQNAGDAKGLSNFEPQAEAAFSGIFLAAGIGLVMANVFLFLIEEEPLRSTHRP